MPIELTDKITPKNAAFTDIVDAKNVGGDGTASNALQADAVASPGALKIVRVDGGNAYLEAIASVPVANGGTGATTLTGYVKGSGTSALTASATIPGTDVSGNISGSAANVTGTVAVANGGTGQTTANAALNALLPSQTSNSGKFLQTDGTNTSWAAGAGGSMVYPGAGIANSTGTAWGTSYTTTGSGTVVALQTSPSFTTPAIGAATGTSLTLSSLTSGRVALTTTSGLLTDSADLSWSGTALSLAATYRFYLGGATSGVNLRQTLGGSLAFATGVSDWATLSSTAFSPSSAGALALGTSSLGWNALYLDESGAGTETAALVAPTLSGNITVTLPAVTSTLATLAGTETLTNKTLTSPVITGGSIDNTPIGATTANTLRGTTLALTSTNNVGSSLVPTAGLSYALGSSGNRWTTVFANSFNATDYIDGNLLGLSATIYSYNGISTQGLGVAAVYSESISSTKTADFTAATYTPPSIAGRYRVSAVITTTSSTNTGTFKITVDYRDSQGTTHTADVIPAQLVSGTTSGYDADGTVTSAASKEFVFGPKNITINNAGVAIVVKVVTTGTVSYTVAPLIEQVG